MAELFKAINYYIEQTNRQVMFEYLMIADFNDHQIEAFQLANLLQQSLSVVNLIPCNPTSKHKASSRVTIEAFKNILIQKGINVTQRYSFGQDIRAACGQLAGQRSKFFK